MINKEAKMMNIVLDKTPSCKIFVKKIAQNVTRLSQSLEIQQAEVLLELFDYIKELDLQVDIAEAQNIYFSKIYHRIGDIISLENISDKDIKLVCMLLDIGCKLNINTEFYRNKIPTGSVC